MATNTATAAQSFNVMKMIEANGKKKGSIWIYNPGWSDERIAIETGTSATSVKYRRREVFGNLYNRNKANKKLNKTIDVSDNGADLQKVLDAIMELSDRIQHLETELGVQLKG